MAWLFAQLGFEILEGLIKLETISYLFSYLHPCFLAYIRTSQFQVMLILFEVCQLLVKSRKQIITFQLRKYACTMHDR